MGLETIAIQDFSGGWQPNSDPLNGPKNGFLSFEHLDLEPTGAIYGGGKLGSVFDVSSGSVAVHTLYERQLSGSRYIYSATSDGHVYEDTTSLTASGAHNRAAFATAFGYIFFCSGSQFKKTIGGGTGNLKSIGLATAASAPTIGATAAGNLNGSYQWMQVYVAENIQGYTTFGQASPITALTTLANLNQALTLLDPTIPEPNATHVYLYRRGGNLDQFYYVGKVAAGTTAYTDNLSDSDVLAQQTLSNQYNLFYSTVNSTNVSSPDGSVYAMVGLVYGRMLYFTAKNIYISKINCPDVFDSRTTIGFCGNNNEIFLFARKLGNNTVIIGTTQDLYLMTGTFQELSPGVLDVTISPLGVPSPPIAQCSDIWNHHLIYISESGWIMYSPTLGYLQGENNLCAGTTDRLYYPENATVNGYSSVFLASVVDSATTSFTCAVHQNKLFVANYLNNNVWRLEVFDLIRKYWKVYPGITIVKTPTMFAGDNGVTFIAIGFTISSIDGLGGTTNFGTNTAKLKTCFIDNGKVRTRKDPFSFRIRCNSGGQTVTVKLAFNGLPAQTTIASFSTSTLAETFIDLGPSGQNIGIFKSVQIEVSVAGASAAFILTDMSLDYSGRAEPLMYYQDLRIELPPELHGRRFRMRAWPITIDTLGQNVSIRPLMNGVVNASALAQTFNTTGKITVLYQVPLDINDLVDLGIRVEAATSTPFELYQVGMPDIVQVFPIAKRFDQVGPFDGFRYTKVKSVRVRMMTDFTGNVPYIIYFQDAVATSGNIAVVANLEDTFEFLVPIATAGHILRIELGPLSAGINFYRYYVQLLCVKTGKDTEQEWITLPEPQNA